MPRDGGKNVLRTAGEHHVRSGRNAVCDRRGGAWRSTGASGSTSGSFLGYTGTMVAELLPVFDPTPSAVAEIARRLPAHERVRIEWFPQALRKTFIEPLARAPADEFHVRLDELIVDAARTVL